jgi:hypothetical protein
MRREEDRAMTMTRSKWVAGLVAVLLAVGCSSGPKTRTVRVEVPPRCDLRPYPMIGIVMFGSNAKGELDRLSTQKFLRAVQDAQPGTRVVELGTESDVLASVSGRAWDVRTIRAVKEAHEVDVLILGRIDVERKKPDVSLSTVFKKMSVSQDVDATLSAKVIETGSGATMWTNSAKCTTNMAHASFNGRGQGVFGASDPEAAYGEMINGLVWNITDDFRGSYVLRRVAVEETAVANAGE